MSDLQKFKGNECRIEHARLGWITAFIASVDDDVIRCRVDDAREAGTLGGVAGDYFAIPLGAVYRIDIIE